MKLFRRSSSLIAAAILAALIPGCGGNGRDSLGNASHQGPPPVALGHSAQYAIFANSGISNGVSPASITGNMGVGPSVTSAAITGFALIWVPGDAFATSAQVAGKIYAVDFAAPALTTVTTASNDMATAYADAAARTDPDFTDLAGGNLGGLTLVPGLYKWSTAVAIAPGSTLTLSGGANDIWILQVSGNLNAGAGCNVVLTGGARAKNVFWQVAGGNATIGAGATFEGILLADGAINAGTSSVVTGRLLSNTTVSLDASIVTGQ